MSMKDDINNPEHYKHGDIECIDAIKAQLTPEEYRGYLKGNIAKYIWRERLKGGTESIKKADWYAKKLIGFDEVKPAQKEFTHDSDGWVINHGFDDGKIPDWLDPHEEVEVVFRGGGYSGTDSAGDLRWSLEDSSADIIKYRKAKPKHSEEIQRMIKNSPEWARWLA